MSAERISDIKMMSADLNLHENLSGSRSALIATGERIVVYPYRLRRP
jgi:hypothetical protein